VMNSGVSQAIAQASDFWQACSLVPIKTHSLYLCWIIAYFKSMSAGAVLLALKVLKLLLSSSPPLLHCHGLPPQV
jgi:hypothetical protein